MRPLLMALFLLGMTSLETAWAQAECRKTGEVCTAPNQTRTIQGMAVTRACWEWKDTYDCRDPNLVSDCAPLRTRGCTQSDSSCVSRDTQGACVMYAQQYKCPDQPATVTQRTVCDQDTFCQSGAGGTCFSTGSVADPDLARAAALLEISRQAGVYGVDTNATEIFKGYPEECSIKVLGGSRLHSCCKTSPGGSAFTNRSLAGAAAQGAVILGSKYVYDTLFQTADTHLVEKGLGAMNSWKNTLDGAAMSPDISFYGFTFDFSLANGFTFTGFDPASFALSVGAMLVAEWLSCESSEQVLSLKRGQNLCVSTGTYCSRRVLGVCVERREKHCCFNSKLAKLINRQGRSQLGLPVDDCGGFSAAQVQGLDFSAMDLSEFITDITPTLPDRSKLTDRAKSTVDQRVQDYYAQ